MYWIRGGLFGIGSPSARRLEGFCCREDEVKADRCDIIQPGSGGGYMARSRGAAGSKAYPVGDAQDRKLPLTKEDDSRLAAGKLHIHGVPGLRQCGIYAEEESEAGQCICIIFSHRHLNRKVRSKEEDIPRLFLAGCLKRDYLAQLTLQSGPVLP